MASTVAAAPEFSVPIRDHVGITRGRWPRRGV